MLRQNTFTLVPNPLGMQELLNRDPDGAPSRPPMTSKQAQKLYKQANRQPKLSKAEQKRLEKEAQEQIRKELDKERQAAKARSARERKKARELDIAAEKKRKGLPTIDVRPSQDTIARFVRGAASGQRTGQKRDSAGNLLHCPPPALLAPGDEEPATEGASDRKMSRSQRRVKTPERTCSRTECKRLRMSPRSGSGETRKTASKSVSPVPSEERSDQHPDKNAVTGGDVAVRESVRTQPTSEAVAAAANSSRPSRPDPAPPKPGIPIPHSNSLPEQGAAAGSPPRSRPRSSKGPPRPSPPDVEGEEGKPADAGSASPSHVSAPDEVAAEETSAEVPSAACRTPVRNPLQEVNANGTSTRHSTGLSTGDVKQHRNARSGNGEILGERTRETDAGKKVLMDGTTNLGANSRATQSHASAFRSAARPLEGAMQRPMGPPPVPRFKAQTPNAGGMTGRPRFLLKKPCTPQSPVGNASRATEVRPQALGPHPSSNPPTSTQLFVLSHLEDLLPSPSQEARELQETTALEASVPRSTPACSPPSLPPEPRREPGSKPGSGRSGSFCDGLPALAVSAGRQDEAIDLSSLISTQDLLSSQDVLDLERGSDTPSKTGKHGAAMSRPRPAWPAGPGRAPARARATAAAPQGMSKNLREVPLPHGSSWNQPRQLVSQKDSRSTRDRIMQARFSVVPESAPRRSLGAADNPRRSTGSMAPVGGRTNGSPEHDTLRAGTSAASKTGLADKRRFFTPSNNEGFRLSRERGARAFREKQHACRAENPHGRGSSSKQHGEPGRRETEEWELLAQELVDGADDFDCLDAANVRSQRQDAVDGQQDVSKPPDTPAKLDVGHRQKHMTMSQETDYGDIEDVEVECLLHSNAAFECMK